MAADGKLGCRFSCFLACRNEFGELSLCRVSTATGASPSGGVFSAVLAADGGGRSTGGGQGQVFPQSSVASAN